MKFILILLVVAQTRLKAAEIEFAESVPQETVYGSTMTARPQAMWIEMINSSKKTLEFEQFYIADKPGEALEPVLAAIKTAAGRGVKVRFIVEKVMMKETGKVLPSLAAVKNIEIRVIDFKKAAGGVQHSKYFIVDGKEVFIGSQNFDWRSLTQIHELGARVKSKRAAGDLGVIFNADWAIAGGADPSGIFAQKNTHPLNAANAETVQVRASTATCYLAFSPSSLVPAEYNWELTELLKLINTAKYTFKAQVMTYSLYSYSGKSRWTALDSALREAGKRGVKVELVFANWAMGGKADADIKSLAGEKNIIVKISSFPAAGSGFIPYARVDHSKYAIADGERAMLSTSNWGPDYFLETRGVALYVFGAAGVAPLADVFLKTWTGPYVEVLDPHKNYERVKKE